MSNDIADKIEEYTLTTKDQPEDGEVVWGFFPDEVFETKRQRLIRYSESEKKWFIKKMRCWKPKPPISEIK